MGRGFILSRGRKRVNQLDCLHATRRNCWVLGQRKCSGLIRIRLSWQSQQYFLVCRCDQECVGRMMNGYQLFVLT